MSIPKQSQEAQLPRVPISTTDFETHGIELVVMGVIVFVAIISLTILSYRLFIKERVKQSMEYQTAAYFVLNSETLSEQLLSPIESFQFTDLQVSEKKDYGVCEVTFNLNLKNQLNETLKLGLVKVADFWVVYQAVLSPQTPAEFYLISTYQKILMMLERLNYQDAKTAQMMLDIIQKEMHDPLLSKYLTARVQAIAGEYEQAKNTLADLNHHVHYSQLAVQFEIAMGYYSEREPNKAIQAFQTIIADYKIAKVSQEERKKTRSIFSGLPKDPLIASFDHDNILADTYQNLALTYFELGQYQEALDMAEKSVQHATEIQSKVVKSSSLFIRALSLYRLEIYEEARLVFLAVTQDLDNTNLSQKAWAYFYLAEIAGRFSRFENSLDYYETAVNLDPFNYLIRKGTIEYLMSRNFAGDLEIALGIALRGIQYDVETPYFRDRVAQIYNSLGMPDKSRAID